MQSSSDRNLETRNIGDGFRATEDNSNSGLRRTRNAYGENPGNSHRGALLVLTIGKGVAPGVSRGHDPVTIEHNARKYELCKEEWRRRHSKFA
jgi:hypothetical protein